jgi:hypothetical protein
MHYRSTNPHFGVFLPPVAFVGDPMQSPVAIRLQVNQVPLFQGCNVGRICLLTCCPSLPATAQVVTEEFGAFINGCSSFRGS